MEECLRILEESKECPSDEILVQQVRLHLTIAQIERGTWYQGTITAPEHNQEPPVLYLQALHSQLQEVKNGFSEESKDNRELKVLGVVVCFLTIQ